MEEIFAFRGLNLDQVEDFNHWINAKPDVFPSQDQWLLNREKGYWLGFNINQPARGAFFALQSGDLLLVRNDEQANLRTRITPMFPGQRWRYLHLGRRYRFRTDMTLSERQDDYAGVQWANMFEVWGAYDGDQGRNPSLEVQLRGGEGEWHIRQRGDSREHHDYDYETVITRKVPFQGAGRYVWEAETVFDYENEGDGELRVWLNGQLVFEEYGIQTTYNSDPFGDGMKLAGICHPAEIYTPNEMGGEPIVVRVHSIEGWELPLDEESSDSSMSSMSSTSSDSSTSESSTSETSESSSTTELSPQQRVLTCCWPVIDPENGKEIIIVNLERAKEMGFEDFILRHPLR